jgi:hypothetical protein
MLFPAAFRLVLIAVMFTQLFFLPATTGMVGSPFGRTAADCAITRAFTGDGVRKHRKAQR